MLKLHLKVFNHERYQRGQSLLDMISMCEICSDWDQRENHLIIKLIWIEQYYVSTNMLSVLYMLETWHILILPSLKNYSRLVVLRLVLYP